MQASPARRNPRQTPSDLMLYSTCGHPPCASGRQGLSPVSSQASQRRDRFYHHPEKSTQHPGLGLAQNKCKVAEAYLSIGRPCFWHRKSCHTRRRARRSSRTHSRSRSTGCSCTPRVRCTEACLPPLGTGSGTRSGSLPPGTRIWCPGSWGHIRTAHRRTFRSHCIWHCWPPVLCYSHTCSCR